VKDKNCSRTIGILRVRHDATSGIYKVDARTKKALPGMRSWYSFKTEDEAIQMALTLTRQIEAGERIEREEDPAIRHTLAKGLKKLPQLEQQKGGPVDPVKFIEEAFAFQEAVVAIQETLKSKGYQFKLWDAQRILKDTLARYQNEPDLRRKSITFDKVIDEYLKQRNSKTGGKKGADLEQRTKDEINEAIGRRLRPVIGEIPVASPDAAFSAAINFINDHRQQDGSSYSPQRKCNLASKINQFGTWIQRRDFKFSEHFLANPFKDILLKFPTPKFIAPTILKAEEVEKIFAECLEPQNRKLIPYCALLFFATVRPGEAFMDGAKNNHRRIQFSYFGEFSESVADAGGGFRFTLPAFRNIHNTTKRTSKLNSPRKAFLSRNGFEWLSWFYKGSIPTTGSIYGSRSIWDRVIKNSEVDWSQDVSRHTITSMCHHNTNFKMPSDFWRNAAGHSEAEFKRSYSNIVSQKECERFFKITPESILEKMSGKDGAL
jgi:hypothetical protein